MAGQHFRFLHAGDFALHEPIEAVADAPAGVRDLLIDAPLLAAERVFGTAIEERVDFVVLSGDLVDLKRATPRAIAFLLEQFQRLDGQGIAVYWAGGKHDPPQDWPSVAKLPKSVQVFSALEPEELSHFRGDRPVANLVGRSWHGTTLANVGQLAHDSDGLTTIAVAYGQGDARELVRRPHEQDPLHVVGRLGLDDDALGPVGRSRVAVDEDRAQVREVLDEAGLGRAHDVTDGRCVLEAWDADHDVRMAEAGDLVPNGRGEGRGGHGMTLPPCAPCRLAMG